MPKSRVGKPCKAQYNLSAESNQNVESKRQSVESELGKRGVQLAKLSQFHGDSRVFCFLQHVSRSYVKRVALFLMTFSNPCVSYDRSELFRL